jgi:hypothetical protein
MEESNFDRISNNYVIMYIYLNKNNIKNIIGQHQKCQRSRVKGWKVTCP